MKRRYLILITGLLITAAMSLGYFLYRSEAEEPEPRIPITPDRKTVLSEDAKLEYIYKYSADNITEITSAPLPPYLVGLDRQQAEEKMQGFTITHFSADKITAVKQLEGESRQHYTLGEYKGYLAVFYKKGGGLKEVTNTPVSALSAEEQKMLVTTEIVGSDKLARVLEDIES